MSVYHNDFVDTAERQCDGKKRFDDKAGAKAFLKKAPWPGRNGSRGEQHVYRCDHCGYFHIGKKPQFAWKKATA
jgi:rubrerythrin